MPTRDKDEGPAVEHLQAGEVAVDKAVSEHRRKIIKASAAVVPAIMTIRSGAAVAMTSVIECVDKDAARPPAESVLGDNEAFALDEWLRVQGVQVRSEEELDAETGEVVEPSVTYYCVENDTGWVCFDGDGGPTTDNKTNSLVKQIINSKDNNNKVKDVYLLAYVDGDTFTYFPQNGVYAGDSLVSGSQCTTSCFCSVNPNSPVCGV